METNLNKNKTQKTYYEAMGYRRSASARVRIYPLTGKKTVSVKNTVLHAKDFIVNGKPASDYFPGFSNTYTYELPLVLTDTRNTTAISVVVTGGGLQGQVDATAHGIAKALDVMGKEKYHDILKNNKLFTRDPRMRERRKAGFAGKARARKQSPKR